MTEENHDDLRPVVASAGRGAAWLLEGFNLFQKFWLEWIGITFILFFIFIASAIVPFASLLLNIFIYVFIAGLMLGCREIDNDGDFSVSFLFRGFSEKFGELALLGVLYFVGSLVIAIVAIVLMIIMLGGLGFISDLQSGQLDNILPYVMSILLAVLVALLFALPLIMAFWFAPALMVLGNLGIVEALKSSFTGCLINIMPFLLYGVVGLILSILASVPLGLGWLILFPMIIASIYLSYKDIYESGTEE